MPDAEFLTPEELAEVTGYKLPGSQREWLDRNGWCYVVNAAQRPVVGRWYARMKLAGVTPGTEQKAGWVPDFSTLS
jgi:hypothetical protein